MTVMVYLVVEICFFPKNEVKSVEAFLDKKKAEDVADSYNLSSDGSELHSLWEVHQAEITVVFP